MGNHPETSYAYVTSYNQPIKTSDPDRVAGEIYESPQLANDQRKPVRVGGNMYYQKHLVQQDNPPTTSTVIGHRIYRFDLSDTVETLQEADEKRELVLEYASVVTPTGENNQFGGFVPQFLRSDGGGMVGLASRPENEFPGPDQTGKVLFWAQDELIPDPDDEESLVNGFSDLQLIGEFDPEIAFAPKVVDTTKVNPMEIEHFWHISGTGDEAIFGAILWYGRASDDTFPDVILRISKLNPEDPSSGVKIIYFAEYVAASGIIIRRPSYYKNWLLYTERFSSPPSPSLGSNFQIDLLEDYDFIAEENPSRKRMFDAVYTDEDGIEYDADITYPFADMRRDFAYKGSKRT